jgi:hypothetical protein
MSRSRLSPLARAVLGVLLGIAVSVPAVALLGRARGAAPRWRLVPEDASGRLRRLAIHYAPSLDARALPVWRRLFTILPQDVEVEVAVSEAPDFERFLDGVQPPAPARFHAVVVHKPLTTWSRDRLAALAGPSGEAAVLAPPRIDTATAARAGDWQAPFALSRAVYHVEPQIADFVFEGGDLAASKKHVFADANLIGHNLGRGDATKTHLLRELGATFTQDVIWLGDEPGDVPMHHIMMYAVPLDDDSVGVGDVHLGMSLYDGDLVDPGDVDRQAARFDHAAALLAARGLRVVRFPVVVLRGAGSYVTYTNALFDRAADGQKIVYLPTYRLPALDAYAHTLYEQLGYHVEEIDLSTMYQLNGSLGCLVNVLARE